MIEILKDLFFSPFGITLLVFILLMILLFLIKPLRDKKKAEKLIIFLEGKISLPLGTIQIPYKKATFNISRIARGAGLSNVGGSFPVLWSYVETCPKLILGNAESKAFTSGNFLRLPPHSVVSISGFDFLIGSENNETTELLKNILNSEQELTKALANLFQKKFAHLCIAHEFHVLGLMIRRKNVLRYICLSEDIYEDPTILADQIKTITELILKLKIHFETT